MWIIRNKWKKQNEELNAKLSRANELYNEVMSELVTMTRVLDAYKEKYPFEIGQTVYDIQLRSSKGRFTKTKASREYSNINEVVVDKKNYFNLVERLANKDVFTTFEAAEAHLIEVCVE